MKRTFFFSAVVVAAAALSSCGGTGSKPSLTDMSISVDSLFSVAEAHVGDTLAIRGVVRHTCKHSGRRCFVTDKDSETDNKLRIEAPEGNSFDASLIGQHIAVRGIVREDRIPAAKVDSLLADLDVKEQSGEAEASHCESSRNNLAAMKAFMELQGRDYYSVIYVDGLEYEVVSQEK